MIGCNMTSAFLSERLSLKWSVMRIVGDAQIAEDLAQETYIRARRAVETGKPIEHVEAFLHKTARNLALDYLRRRKLRTQVEAFGVAEQSLENVADPVVSLEDALIEREKFQQLKSVLSSVPDRARKAWILSQVEGMSYSEVAESLGVSRNTVYNDVKMVMGACYDAIARLD